MDTLQCAVLLAKLERFDWEIEQRIKIGQRYTELLNQSSRGPVRPVASHHDSSSRSADGGAATYPITVRPDRTSVYAQYTLICPDRDSIRAKLRQAEIPTAIHYPLPLNEQAAYKHLCCPDCTPIASALAKQVLSLPMSPDLSEQHQQMIVAQLLQSKSIPHQ
jgi:UDP-2-acetamido-2-deoxy-ribo-hexuluronate aminotransferase